MNHLALTENSEIRRAEVTRSCTDGGADLCDSHYKRLRAFDQDREDRVFDWRDNYARTTQWVGVVQIPGLQIEILPKIDRRQEPQAGESSDRLQFEARRNLLYMLSISGHIPLRSRDLARLRTRRAPLGEVLAGIFADRLKRELLRGCHREYQEKEENLRNFRGKVCLSRQILLNAGHRERFFCGFDEFSNDVLINRIFRASCHLLLSLTHTPATQDVLRQCLLLLEGVSEVEVHETDLNRVTIDRQNERFKDVLSFCRLLLTGRRPTIEAGGTRTFSLLFDMNKVFERFVAGFLGRYVTPRISGVQFLRHAFRHSCHFMESEGKGVLRLEPDILVVGPEERRLVIDTKWKLLASGRGALRGVAEADLYQLYAYTRRYKCRRSILLYPYIPGVQARDFDVLDGDGTRSERVSVRQVSIHRNLHLESGRLALAQELFEIVGEGLGLLPELRSGGVAA